VGVGGCGRVEQKENPKASFFCPEGLRGRAGETLWEGHLVCKAVGGDGGGESPGMTRGHAVWGRLVPMRPKSRSNKKPSLAE